MLSLIFAFFFLLYYARHFRRYRRTVGLVCGLLLVVSLIKWLWVVRLLYIVVGILTILSHYYKIVAFQCSVQSYDAKTEQARSGGRPLKMKTRRREMQSENTKWSLAQSVKQSVAVVRNRNTYCGLSWPSSHRICQYHASSKRQRCSS